MVFSDYMNGLSTERVSEKAAKITQIAQACCKSELTVYNWIGGRTSPSTLDRKVIAGVLNMPEGELFPEQKA